ncbi:MAG: hypothetical protein ACI4AM_05805, partial [Muribaculaceae bacterium]
IDLEDFTGKVIQLRFAGEIVDRTLIPIDNVRIYDARPDSNIDAEVSDIVSIEYYNVAGVRVANPSNGVFVKVTRYADGTSVAEKVIR